MMTGTARLFPLLTLSCCIAAALMLGACSSLKTPFSSTEKAAPKSQVYLNENFQADETFSRLFDGGVEDTCEAARRALLSQGYLISDLPDKSRVNGRKRFQPEGEVHVEINFNVVCVPDGQKDRLTTVFVSALQDRYSLKKSPNSTSIGVSAIGSISLPLSSSDDALVKVASETIPAGAFYDRFFALMLRLVSERASDKSGSAANLGG
ncbi:DUF2242 domain-containing protein [Roseateles sp.]|uniref:DUF2242 domain-containing protein n=1 Tax=Roseateles sp. TaxID=1971397 RepID=UPI003BA58E7C